jgi:hypothetical protein
MLLQTNSNLLSFQLMSPCVLPARRHAPQHNVLSARDLRGTCAENQITGATKMTMSQVADRFLEHIGLEDASSAWA